MKKERRILVVGDIHAPFCLDGYLEFCKDVYAKYNLNQVSLHWGHLGQPLRKLPRDRPQRYVRWY